MIILLQHISRLLRSRYFLRAILVFFVLEASWIAISAAYPQAFDENFHFGLIKLYSHHWLPFLSQQPKNANAFGAVARDPSYLYHYVMSFPYRLIALVIHGQTGQVIALRFMNIALFGSGLVLLRRVLIRVGISDSLANVSLLTFTLIPIVPQLAAQINYDNLLIPATAGVILLSFRVIDELRSGKQRADHLLLLLSACFLTSIVKFAFLPIFLAIVLFFVVLSIRINRHHFKQVFKTYIDSYNRLRLPLKLGLSCLLLISLGMFLQRDGINLIRYHDVDPNCNAVLSVADCKAYSPWYYNYVNHMKVEKQLASGSLKFTNPVSYAIEWLYWMWYRLFFAITGPTSGFQNFPPLPIPAATAIIVGCIGIFGTIKWWKRIFRSNVYLVLLFLVSAVYCLVLFVQGYQTYRYTDILENMNGRYLLPILLFVAAIIGRGISLQLQKATIYKPILATAVVLLFLQGGGVFTFISRSDDSWDTANHTVKKVNDVARHITSPIIIDGKKNYSTHFWLFN